MRERQWRWRKHVWVKQGSKQILRLGSLIENCGISSSGYQRSSRFTDFARNVMRQQRHRCERNGPFRSPEYLACYTNSWLLYNVFTCISGGTCVFGLSRLVDGFRKRNTSQLAKRADARSFHATVNPHYLEIDMCVSLIYRSCIY